ncbi:hypothetical protein D9M70_528360 [compost metagenome]
MPSIEAALELDGRELGQHRHRDGEVDAIGGAHEEAARQNDFKRRREHHEQRADDGKQLGDDQRPYAAPPVRHPPADRVEGDGHPRCERRHQRDLLRRERQVARHGAQARAQRRIRECVEEQSTQRQPPDEASPAYDARA